MFRTFLLASLVLGSVQAIAPPGQQIAQAQTLVPPIFSDQAGIAIRGTDPVAYFRLGEATPGDPAFNYQWMDTTWYFSSADHRDHFAADPEAYAPQFGGYCAFAVANGYTASIDPEAWRIVDGKLYLNFSLGVQRSWERDIPGFIARAIAEWPSARSNFSR